MRISAALTWSQSMSTSARRLVPSPSITGTLSSRPPAMAPTPHSEGSTTCTRARSQRQWESQDIEKVPNHVHRHQEPGALSVRHRDVLTQAACRCSHSPLQRCMACARFHTSEQWVAWRYAGSKCPLSGDLAFPVLLRLCNMQMLHSSTFKYLDAYCT